MDYKKKRYVDIFLMIGLLLYVAYTIINRFIIKLSDIVAYPWMIISCVCTFIGVYRTGKKLGSHGK